MMCRAVAAPASSRGAEIEKRGRDLGSGILAESFGSQHLPFPPTPLNIGVRLASEGEKAPNARQMFGRAANPERASVGV
jgi:hypothetical protein